MSQLRVESVDTSDAGALRRWNDVLRDGYNAGRKAAWWRSAEATVMQFQSPRPQRTSVALLALDGGTPVGAAEAHVDPGEPAVVEVSVLPDRRRRGIGRALADVVREHLQGVAESVQVETYSDAGVAFATSLGLHVGNQELRQLLELPVPVEHLDELDRDVADVEVRSWLGSCPDDTVEDWAMLTTQMDADVPLGDLTRSARATGVEDVRRSERRMQEQGYVLVRSLARLDGRAVGYTEILVASGAPEIVIQDDTLVERTSRGRGIGRALKVANLRQLAVVPEAARGKWLQTYTATTNEPMLALNRTFGFARADILTVLEGPLAAR